MSIFKPCDVRGVVGAEWGDAEALAIGRSLGAMLRARDQQAICVGGDFRRSTPSLKASLIQGLQQAGVDVDDVGQVPTPVVQFAARQARCANVAIVTASHNPGKYNGVKFVVNGRPPIPELMRELQARLTPSEPPPAGDLRSRGRHTSRHVVADYEIWVVRSARELVAATYGAGASEPGAVSAGPAPQRVAVDAMGGAFTEIAPRVLAAAGYGILTVTPHIDPAFAQRDPNPAQDRNLRQLVDAVREGQADLGIALDGDGDRVIFVDHDGGIARPEQIAALLVERCYRGGTVVYDQKCASIVPRTVRAHGGEPVIQPSGHGFIKTTMLDRRAELGVEVSGHHFFGALEGGDDGLFTALFVLELLRRVPSSLRAQLQRIGWPSITPDLRVPLRGDSRAVLESIAAHCGGDISRLDGVRAQYADGWALARASITEPAMTFRFESDDPAQLQQVIDRFLAGAPELREPLRLSRSASVAGSLARSPSGGLQP